MTPAPWHEEAHADADHHATLQPTRTGAAVLAAGVLAITYLPWLTTALASLAR